MRKTLLIILLYLPTFAWGQMEFFHYNYPFKLTDSDYLISDNKVSSSISFSETATSFFSPIGVTASVASITLGVASHYVDGWESVNQAVDNFFWNEWHFKHPFDNYLQFGPMASCYLLKACGVPSKHGWGTLALLNVTTVLTVTTVVQVSKRSSHVLRPDGNDYFSFPSGHTAFAFSGAEMLRLEYKDVSPWIGVAGYLMATTTGVMRMYNKCHWAGDVIAGAGIGFLSAHLNYCVAEIIEKKHHSNTNVSLLNPYILY